MSGIISWEAKIM